TSAVSPGRRPMTRSAATSSSPTIGRGTTKRAAGDAAAIPGMLSRSRWSRWSCVIATRSTPTASSGTNGAGTTLSGWWARNGSTSAVAPMKPSTKLACPSQPRATSPGATASSPSLAGRVGARLATKRIRGSEDRVHDRRVAGAAAEVAGELGPDLLLGRRRVLLEEELRGDQDPGRAEAALETEVLVEGLLQRVQLRLPRERLHRLDRGAVRLHRERQARSGGPAVEQHRAGAADSVLAADLRSVELQLVADEVGEQEPRLD